MTEIHGIVPALAKALEKRGYSELTPVQHAVIADELNGADALVSAQTGSGKTVAFGLAIAPTLLGRSDKFTRAEMPLALVVAPTRELALQVKRELDWLYQETGAIIASCVGGMDMRTERRTLARGAHIVVGTPGRLCDHIRRNSLDPSQLKAVVLDEADEMLDLGFREDLEFILETTPEDRRTLMFSATVPQSIARMAKKYQRDAVRVSTSEEKKQHVDIEYRALVVAIRERENAIINVLRFYEAKNALVFCNTRATVNHMVARFNNRGFSVVALSGELSQSERTHALQAMRDGRARVCIATDVAARGIDLPNLELVVHAELPTNPETLLHRSGRTGRAGRKGVSALIVDHKGRKRAERLLRFAKIDATWAAPPSADEVNKRDEERILADAILSDPLKDDETEFVSLLTKKFTPEQIATAFVRLNRAGRSAPEELESQHVSAPEPYARDGKRERHERQGRSDRPDRNDRNDQDRPKRPRDDFDESIWFSISVGRKQNAEPRWLIPLMCNAGEISKREIGVIKMQNEETFVQLDANYADKFFDALGPNQVLEKNITVKRLEGVPKFGATPDIPARKHSGDDAPRGKKDWSKKPKRGPEDGPKKPFRKKVFPVASTSDVPAEKQHTPKPDSKTEADSGEKRPPNKAAWAKKKPRSGSKPGGKFTPKAKKPRHGPTSKADLPRSARKKPNPA